MFKVLIFDFFSWISTCCKAKILPVSPDEYCLRFRFAHFREFFKKQKMEFFFFKFQFLLLSLHEYQIGKQAIHDRSKNKKKAIKNAQKLQTKSWIGEIRMATTPGEQVIIGILMAFNDFSCICRIELCSVSFFYGISVWAELSWFLIVCWVNRTI